MGILLPAAALGGPAAGWPAACLHAGRQFASLEADSQVSTGPYGTPVDTVFEYSTAVKYGTVV